MIRFLFRELLLCQSASLKGMQFRGFRFVPNTFSETKPQMVKGDLNIGFPLFGFESGPNLQPCISPVFEKLSIKKRWKIHPASKKEGLKMNSQEL